MCNDLVRTRIIYVKDSISNGGFLGLAFPLYYLS